jgi:hypothetical protein
MRDDQVGQLDLLRISIAAKLDGRKLNMGAIMYCYTS